MKISPYSGKKSGILSALTYNDAAFWGADAFVAVVFALYITQNIEGGSAIHVGLVFGLYRAVRAFLSVPIGRFLDKRKGHIDEYYMLFLSGLMVGLTYLALFFSTELWHVYLGMLFIGIGHSLDVNSWRILFYGNVPDDRAGEVNGIYETIMQIVYGLAIIIAGFVGEIFGFEWTLFWAGIATLSSSLILIFVRDSKGKM